MFSKGGKVSVIVYAPGQHPQYLAPIFFLPYKFNKRGNICYSNNISTSIPSSSCRLVEADTKTNSVTGTLFQLPTIASFVTCDYIFGHLLVTKHLTQVDKVNLGYLALTFNVCDTIKQVSYG
jgi:hypothetical protein